MVLHLHNGGESLDIGTRHCASPVAACMDVHLWLELTCSSKHEPPGAPEPRSGRAQTEKLMLLTTYKGTLK